MLAPFKRYSLGSSKSPAEAGFKSLYDLTYTATAFTNPIGPVPTRFRNWHASFNAHDYVLQVPRKLGKSVRVPVFKGYFLWQLALLCCSLAAHVPPQRRPRLLVAVKCSY